MGGQVSESDDHSPVATAAFLKTLEAQDPGLPAVFAACKNFQTFVELCEALSGQTVRIPNAKLLRNFTSAMSAYTTHEASQKRRAIAGAPALLNPSDIGPVLKPDVLDVFKGLMKISLRLHERAMKDLLKKFQKCSATEPEKAIKYYERIIDETQSLAVMMSVISSGFANFGPVNLYDEEAVNRFTAL